MSVRKFHGSHLLPSLALVALGVTVAGCCCIGGGGTFTPTPSPHITTVTDTDFTSLVIESDQPMLVDFWASWCGPCHMIDPALVVVAEEFQDQINTGRLNVDDSPVTATEYNVWSIPTLAIFHNGELVARHEGIPGDGMNIERGLREWLKAELASLPDGDATDVPQDAGAEAAADSDVIE